jgi:hypothetical protein
MENRKQSSIGWLYERLERMIPRGELYNIDKKQYLEKAKEMHKQEIMDAYNEGFGEGWGNIITHKEEEYYNQTFNQ